MYDPEFLNASWGPAKTSKGRQPQSKRVIQDHRDEGDSLRAAPLKLNERKEIQVGGKRKYAYIKPMLSLFPESIQTHLLQIFPKERNMMLFHLDC